MSQESNHVDGHQDDNKAAVSFKASFWVVIILVGVFICAINFVKVMSSNEGEGKEGVKTEMTKPAGESAETKTSSTEANTEAKPAEETKKTDSPKTEAKH